MSTSARAIGRAVVVKGAWVAVCIGAAAAAYWAWNRFIAAERLPWLALPDVADDGSAGKVDLLKGTAKINDKDAKRGDTFPIGATFKIPQGSEIQVHLEGNWTVALKEGDFVLEDARVDEAHANHTMSWKVLGGSFRAKPHDYDPSGHVMQVVAPTARLLVDRGEIGMRVAHGGGGQMWLVRGKVVIQWNDGRTQTKTSKGIEAL